MFHQKHPNHMSTRQLIAATSPGFELTDATNLMGQLIYVQTAARPVSLASFLHHRFNSMKSSERIGYSDLFMAVIGLSSIANLILILFYSENSDALLWIF